MAAAKSATASRSAQSGMGSANRRRIVALSWSGSQSPACQTPLALLASCGGKRWVVEYAGPVLDELDAAVEGSAIDHVERDVGVAIVDAF